MEKLKEIFDTFMFYFLLYLGYIIEGIKYIAKTASSYIEVVIIPAMPTVLKMFSNRTINMTIFIIIVGYFLIMNLVAFSMFGSDKSKAKKQKTRISEKKLLKLCILGGAIGGFIGMLCFNHKTRKKRFYIFVPIIFVLQVVIESFIIGFLGFWAFFY